MATVRAARKEDAEFLMEGNTRMAFETEGLELNREVLEAGVRTALQNPALGDYFIAEVNGKPAGQLLITREWSDWRNGNFWWIQSVYVLPEFRRMGVFRALYNHIRDLAHKSGAAGVRLYVEHENQTAQSTYSGLGMKKSAYLIMEEEFSSE